MSHVCHDLETKLSESQEGASVEQVAVVERAWSLFRDRVVTLIGGSKRDVWEIPRPELAELIDRVRCKAPYRELLQLVECLAYEPVAVRFERAGAQVVSLAEKLGKPRPQLRLESNSLRLPAERWVGFWAAFVHLLRNTVDHGLESSEERQAAGKPIEGVVLLRAIADSQAYTIELQDDGHGIDWSRSRKKAEVAGLPHGNHDELFAALFADGISTRDTASETSGRGVGMGAVMQETLALGGTVEVESTLGQGALFRFRFPPSVAKHSSSARPMAAQG